MPSTAGRALASRATIATFGTLAATWFLPGAVSTLAPGAFTVVGPALRALAIPAYLLTLLVYDGGLEVVVSPVADAIPVAGTVVRDAGLLAVFYAFAVAAVAAGRALGRLARRIEPRSGDGPRYVVAGALVVFGALLLVSGAVNAVTSPTVSVTSCTATGAASEGGAVTTVTGTCTTETRPSTFPAYAAVGGLAASIAGAIVVIGDVGAARRGRS